MEQLKINEKNGANYVLYELIGSLTSFTISEIQEKVYDAVQKQNVILDLGATSKLDSTGMGMIFSAFNEAEEAGNVLYIMHPSLEARRVMDATGFTESFSIIYSVTEVV